MFLPGHAGPGVDIGEKGQGEALQQLPVLHQHRTEALQQMVDRNIITFT